MTSRILIAVVLSFFGTARAEPVFSSARMIACENAAINLLTLRKRPEWIDVDLTIPPPEQLKTLSEIEASGSKRMGRSIMKNDRVFRWVQNQFRNIASLGPKESLPNFFVDRVPYTYILFADHATFAKSYPDLVSNVLSKHLFLARRRTDPMYAGEFWVDHKARTIVVDNGSGTFMPDGRAIPEVVAYFAQMFPDYEVRGLTITKEAYRSTYRELTDAVALAFVGRSGQLLDDAIDDLVERNSRQAVARLARFIELKPKNSIAVLEIRTLLLELEGTIGKMILANDLLRDAVAIGVDDATLATLAEDARSARRELRDVLVLRHWFDASRTPLTKVRRLEAELALDAHEEVSRAGAALGNEFAEIASRVMENAGEENVHSIRKIIRQALFYIDATKAFVSLTPIGPTAPALPLKGYSESLLESSKYVTAGGPPNSYYRMNRADFLALIHWSNALGLFKDGAETSRLIAKASEGRLKAEELERRFNQNLFASPYSNAQDLLNEIRTSGVLERLQQIFSVHR